jgi:hypothetical protein
LKVRIIILNGTCEEKKEISGTPHSMCAGAGLAIDVKGKADALLLVAIYQH